MKRMKFEDEVTLTDLKGDTVIAFTPQGPITGNGGPPMTVNHLDFLLGKLADPKVLAKARKEGMEGVIWTMGVRDEIVNQAKKAEKCGWWYFEDDRGEALRDVILNPTNGYNQSIGHSFFPFLESAKNMEDVPKTDGESPPIVPGRRSLKNRTQ